MSKYLVNSKKSSTFALAFVKKEGAIAQLVEQRTENPCVPGSIPGGTTTKIYYQLLTRSWEQKRELFHNSSLSLCLFSKHFNIINNLYDKNSSNDTILDIIRACARVPYVLLYNAITSLHSALHVSANIVHKLSRASADNNIISCQLQFSYLLFLLIG